MEIRQEIVLDNAKSDGRFSIRKQNYIEINGQRSDLGMPERQGFCPGEFDALREYAPGFEAMAIAIWTKEKITAWQQKQAE